MTFTGFNDRDSEAPTGDERVVMITPSRQKNSRIEPFYNKKMAPGKKHDVHGLNEARKEGQEKIKVKLFPTLVGNNKGYMV